MNLSANGFLGKSSEIIPKEKLSERLKKIMRLLLLNMHPNLDLMMKNVKP